MELGGQSERQLTSARRGEAFWTFPPAVKRVLELAPPLPCYVTAAAQGLGQSFLNSPSIMLNSQFL